MTSLQQRVIKMAVTAVSHLHCKTKRTLLPSDSHWYIGVGTEQSSTDELIRHDVSFGNRCVIRLGAALPGLKNVRRRHCCQNAQFSSALT